MMTTLYPWVFFALTFFGIVMVYRTNNEKKTPTATSAIMLLGILYLIIMFTNDGGFFTKFFTIFLRDVALLALIAGISKILVSNFKTLFLVMLTVFIGLGLFYYGVLKNSYKPNIELSSEGEILFDVKDHADLDKIKELLKDYEINVELAFPDLKRKSYSELDDFYVLDLADKDADEVSEVIEILMQSGLIDHAETNEIIKIEPQETDLPISQSIDYGINDPMVSQLWGFSQMDVKALYDYLKDSNIKPRNKAVVAILDTGVDNTHEDLSDNYHSTDSKYDKDVQGHGTHCAGIAGAVTNNGKGIASLSPLNNFVTITSIKVLSDEGWGTQRDIINGMIKAADLNVAVLSMSLGGSATHSRQKAYEEAVLYAQKSGSIVIVAAGNENDNAKRHVPAACKGVITVSAVDSKLNRATFSNYVTDIEMGIAAPGVQILSSLPQNNYAAWNGTSMATPYVSGLVGLLKALKPSLTTEQVYRILNETGKDTQDTKETGKFIQPEKAIRMLNEL